MAVAIAVIMWVGNEGPVAAPHQVALPANGASTVEMPLEIPGLSRSPEGSVSAQEKGLAMVPSLEPDPVSLADGIGMEPAPAAGNEPPAGVWQEVTVKSGDSLAVIFDRLGLTPQQLHNLLAQGGAAHNLKKIYPGQTFNVLISAARGLEKLTYRIDELSTLEVTRKGEEFEISTSHRTPERQINNASGTISSSLFVDAQKAGMSDKLIMELANIFGWDIDFALDLRSGDQFTVLYEELFLDGERIGNGDIIAAEFVNRGRKFQAFRYTDKGGKTDYYSLNGKSMRKTFLRTPVEFSRISSRFSLGRKHPILNRIRAHKGVDYAASTGTPIRATGHGKIIHRGRKGGYGNTIIIQHGTKYSTLYAHMSKFRSGLQTGSHVQQGQIIGYVGSSGLATGPHLHYEFRINGVHRDPLRVKLPGAEPLDNKYMADFRSKAESLIARLDLVRSVQVASSE
ncbi:MAG: peptidoglycan DD-metalloendopeptidase family protein [Gammaproteobacteria bacterium]|jgi:murein DD-endopeptidase MepM/ murein hydrolase activator NlpD